MHGLELDEEDDGLGEGFMSAAGIGSNNRGLIKPFFDFCLSVFLIFSIFTLI